jgi:hypothetical protein
VVEIHGLRVKSLREKMSVERLKLPKPEVPEVDLHHRSGRKEDQNHWIKPRVEVMAWYEGQELPKL